MIVFASSNGASRSSGKGKKARLSESGYWLYGSYPVVFAAVIGAAVAATLGFLLDSPSQTYSELLRRYVPFFAGCWLVVFSFFNYFASGTIFDAYQLYEIPTRELPKKLTKILSDQYPRLLFFAFIGSVVISIVVFAVWEGLNSLRGLFVGQ
jgi:hypothetical protein